MATSRSPPEHVVYAIREVHRAVGPQGRHPRPQPGRHEPPLGPALVARHPGHGRRLRRDRPQRPRRRRPSPPCAATATARPAIWQQTYMSNFVRAMNSGGETFPGIDYTVAWTAYDEFLTPPESTRIAGRHQHQAPGHLPRRHVRPRRHRHPRPGHLRHRHGRPRPRRPGRSPTGSTAPSASRPSPPTSIRSPSPPTTPRPGARSSDESRPTRR